MNSFANTKKTDAKTQCGRYWYMSHWQEYALGEQIVLPQLPAASRKPLGWGLAVKSGGF